MDICTIVAKNYIAQARVLARSFAACHPDGRCHVLVIDEWDGYLTPTEEQFRILTPAQIGCEEFEEMAARYSVLELSTAVKPWLLAHLLGEGIGAITYLDPDIRVYSSLARLDELAREHGVVLTPHNTEPIPDDGERPGQVDILLAGVYNLGYVSLGAGGETEQLLKWWRERLFNDCRVDPFRGYFVDQRWFDLAPGLVSDRAIVREPRYNLAYWNLHAHDLACDDGVYTVDGEPLAFFHFSGYDPRVPHELSRHQTRVPIVPGSALERLCGEYSQALEDCGFTDSSGWPYTYDVLPSGVHYSQLLRRLYATACEQDPTLQSPFTQVGSERFLGWLSASDPAGPAGVSRALMEVYRARPDLQAAYTDLSDDAGGLLAWAQSSGVVEEPVLGIVHPAAGNGRSPSQPVAPVPQAEPAVENPPLPAARTAPERAKGAHETPAERLQWGVNVVGYFRSELGTGEAARQVVSALDAAAVPLLPLHGRTIPANRQGHMFTHLDCSAARYPVNVICMNADMLAEFAAQAGPAFFDGRHTIGVWFWELDSFPPIWHEAFEHVDELWLPTDHMVRAIGAVSPVPVLKVTLPVELGPVLPATRAELDLPQGFMFLFSFDYHSVFERKNPLGVVNAYTRAFSPQDGTVLVVKSINADSDPASRERLLAAAAGRPDIHIVDGYLSPARRDLLVASCDCYVSLHRAEGFGFTMAEAMYLGKPVVATGYSGNLDFMSDANSYLVDHTLVAIGPDAPPYPAAGRWAEPDVEHAAHLMREVFEQPLQAHERADRGRSEMHATHSAAVAGAIMRARLDLLRESGRGRERPGRLALTAAGTSSQELLRQAQAGPLPTPRLRLGGLGARARRLLLRALKPYTAFQKSINEGVARSLTELQADVDAASEAVRVVDLEVAERHADVLAELRALASARRIWQRIVGLTHSTVALESAVSDLAVEAKRLGWEVEHTRSALHEAQREAQQLRWQSEALPFTENPPFRDMTQKVAGVVQGFQLEQDAGAGDAYRTFEDVFRGSEEMIRERQRKYLEILAGREPVLDFGCGRGEFLDLLADADIPYLAVDSDSGMVRRCHEKGHAGVVEADGIEYLEGLQDTSLGAIFCAQVIEHLPYEALLRLIAVSRRKLRADGILIAETVNPHCAPALKTFWVDLTHQHPIFPEVALELCRSAGFAAAFVFHPNGTGDVTRDRFSSGEYAVVAGARSLLE